MCESYDDYMEGMRSERDDAVREEYMLRMHLEREGEEL